MDIPQVKCGPSGKGYKFKLPSHLLKMLAPALRWGLLIMKIILATQGEASQTSQHLTAMHCTTPYCTAPYRTILYCTVLSYTSLYCTEVY